MTQGSYILKTTPQLSLVILWPKSQTDSSEFEVSQCLMSKMEAKET